LRQKWHGKDYNLDILGNSGHLAGWVSLFFEFSGSLTYSTIEVILEETMMRWLCIYS
jgi:hypothetical protein